MLVYSNFTKFSSHERNTELCYSTLHVYYTILLHTNQSPFYWIIDPIIDFHPMSFCCVILHEFSDDMSHHA